LAGTEVKKRGDAEGVGGMMAAVIAYSVSRWGRGAGSQRRTNQML